METHTHNTFIYMYSQGNTFLSRLGPLFLEHLQNSIVKISNSISSHLSRLCLGIGSKSLIIQLAPISISTVLKTRPNQLVQSDEPRIGQVKTGKNQQKIKNQSPFQFFDSDF